MVKFGGMTSVRVELNGFERMLAGPLTVLVTDAPGGAAADACGPCGFGVVAEERTATGLSLPAARARGTPSADKTRETWERTRIVAAWGQACIIDRPSPLAAEAAPMQHPGSAAIERLRSRCA